MERFAFIHGSSVGQSTFLPNDVPSSICNDIADKYFKGRISRQKESNAKEALFVDLYKSASGDSYCIYSYVNNYCRGANDREGQYFALSILSKDIFFYPEDIYRMLNAAYEQMLNTDKILSVVNGEVQYRIQQFSEQKEYLSAFLNKVVTIFGNKVGNIGKVIEEKCSTADYDSWHGVKTSLDTCNSLASYNNLCDTGRLYISDTYESPLEKNRSLEKDIQSLRKERADLEKRIAKMMESAGSKARDEIAKLQEVINVQEAEIKSSKSQLEEYEATIDIVYKQLDKYAKFGKKISNAQEKKTQYEEKGKKDLLKICLLFIVLLLTIANGLLSYCFFRDFSPTLKKETKGEIVQNVVPFQEKQPQANQTSSTSATIGTETERSSSFLTVVPKSITADAQGGVKELKIKTDGVWNKPVVPDAAKGWLSLEKIDDEKLQITIKKNETSNDRISTFMIGSGSHEHQIKVTQSGTVLSAQTCPDYGIVIRDQEGKTLSKGDKVSAGQILTATVTNPSMKATGYGWTCSNCTTLDHHKNNKEIRVTVNEGLEDGATVAIGYGKLPDDGNNNANLREKIQFKFMKMQNKTIEISQSPVTSESIGMGNEDSTEISVESTPSTSNE